MAQQGLKKDVSAAVQQPLRMAAPRVGKGKTAEWDYTRFRISISDPDAFMEYMRGYPHTEGVTLFLYRLVPPSDISRIGLRESNIQKGGYADLSLFSFDAVAEKFGRGKYNVKVTDSNRPEGQREVVKSCQYKIADAEKPPVYDIRTLQLGHTDAIDEVNRLITGGVLVRDSNGAPRLRTTSDGVPVQAAPAAAGSGDLFTPSLFRDVLVSALNRGAANPHDTVRDTIEIAKLLAPPARPELDLEMIVERVVTRLNRPAVGSELDAFTVYEKVEKFLGRVRGGGIDGAAVASNGDSLASWAPHLPQILEQGRGLVSEIFAGLMSFRHAPAAAQRPVTVEQRIEEIARMGLDKMKEGVSGFDFASYVCGFHPGGLEIYRALEPTGAAGLISLGVMNPATRPLFNDPAARPQLESFLADFFTFDPGSPSDESDASAGLAAG